MRTMSVGRELILGVAFFAVMGWANPAHAQLGVGTTWLRTDAQGKGITLTVQACCRGGLRLIYKIPSMGAQPAATLTVDSPMDGTDVPALLDGKPSGQTMAAKRVDDHHYSAVVTMNGKPFLTSKGAVSTDDKTMTVESVSQTGTIIETWVRK